MCNYVAYNHFYKLCFYVYFIRIARIFRRYYKNIVVAFSEHTVYLVLYAFRLLWFVC